MRSKAYMALAACVLCLAAVPVAQANSNAAAQYTAVSALCDNGGTLPVPTSTNSIVYQGIAQLVLANGGYWQAPLEGDEHGTDLFSLVLYDHDDIGFSHNVPRYGSGWVWHAVSNGACATAVQQTGAFVCWHVGDDPSPYPLVDSSGEMTAGRALAMGAFSPAAARTPVAGPTGLFTMISGTADAYLHCSKVPQPTAVVGGSGEGLTDLALLAGAGYYPAG